MDWWGGFCCDCGLSTLERSVLQVLKTDCALDASIYHVGHFSRFRLFLSNAYKNVQSSQYKTGIHSGTWLDGVRYEDITGLTFPDETFDCVVCMEILEHLPDYNAALAEIFRITKSGGMAIFSFPLT